MSELCPCGSGRPLDECCGPYLEGKAWPDDADTMVRSRFSAYCLGKFDYLVETTHPAYREDLTAQMLEEQTRDVHWLRLDMGPCEKDQPEGENGELFDTAEFYAYYELEGSVRQIGERSFFQRKDGKLYYVDGVARRPKAKVGRNDPCPCGSGKKYKKCCGRESA